MFSHRLRELREDLGLTQKQLAEMLNLTQSTIAYYENGRKMPTLENAVRITKIFNTSLDYLVGVTDRHQALENIKEDRVSYYDNKCLSNAIGSLSADSLKELVNFIDYLKYKDNK